MKLKFDQNVTTIYGGHFRLSLNAISSLTEYICNDFKNMGFYIENHGVSHELQQRPIKIVVAVRLSR